MTDTLRVWWKLPELSDRLTMLVIVGTRSAEHSLRSQVIIGSESHCLLKQLTKILEVSASEAGLKVVKSGGVYGEEGECGGDDVEELLVRERRSLDILSVRKEARLSARALAEVQVGRGEGELRCNSLFIVCQRRRGLSEDEETRLE